ncbi:MAG: ATP-binding protein [Clostridiales Family XIII bacterium]|jgi:AAA+ ATPase superfamily predicted ATPase|nr:ATP-binding protein [Clostridiales Family XIII bacterium]
MFIGRNEELKSLTGYYNSGKYECAVIYGRRRVGKTELITEFVKDKKHIYFTAVEGTYQKNLDMLSKAVFNGLDGGIHVSSPTFADFADCLDHIYNHSQEKLVVIIDEYPYFAQSEQSVSSVLQQYIDHKFQRRDIMFILCGSSMSFMEKQVMGNKSPLYGRRTCQYKLQPFDFKTSMEFHGGFDKREQAVVYAITGGIPKYLLQIDGSKSPKENIVKNFFSPNGLLFEEPNNLLKQELREPAVYNAIITAIATGSSKLNEIATKAHMTTSACSNYLKSLISLNIVRKELPILAKANARNTIYRLNDGMFRFWYKFVYDNVSEISMHQGEAIYTEIEQQISDFMGEAFEDICKQWMWRENFAGRLPFRFKDCGRWWGTNPRRRAEQEIDLLAYNRDKTGAIFCECKWTNEKISDGIIVELIDKSEMFGYGKKHYYLFSKSGFTPAALKRANDDVRLISFDDMY